VIEALEDMDQQLFLFLNSLNHPALDQAMYLMTDQMFWIPAYLLMLWMVYKSYGWKTALWSLAGAAVAITLGDRISVELFKNVFERYRPSHNLDIGDVIHTVNNYRGGKYGFVSSHAANSFAVATFIFLVIRAKFPQWAWWVLFWAALFSYTRIYLGVHYPADIACGALLGAGIGQVVYLGFQKWIIERYK